MQATPVHLNPLKPTRTLKLYQLLGKNMKITNTYAQLCFLVMCFCLLGPLGSFGALQGPIGPNMIPPCAETQVIYPILDIFDVNKSVMFPHVCPPAPM